MVKNPIILAIDTADRPGALALAVATAEFVGAFKIGLGLLHGPGPGLIAELRDLGRPVFADAKLHDIPTQVERGARALGNAGARWVTVHASGGAEMVAAAVAGLAAGSDGSGGILGVTVLTSLDAATLSSVGIAVAPNELVASMARVVAGAGAEGVVCSPHEIGIVKTAAPGLEIVTPGIRPSGAQADDQKRTAEPATAITAGATWLVVGRPITGAKDPAAAAATIAAAAVAAGPNA